MPKQKRNIKQKPFVPKNQRSGQKRRKRVRNIVIIVTLVVIVAVIGIVGWNIYYFQLRPYNQALIRFNGVTLDMRYFINMLKLNYGKAPAGTSISDFADYVEQQIERNETIIQGSMALGVQIKRNDIEEALKKSGNLVTRESVDSMMAQQLVEKQVPGIQPQVHVQAMILEDETAAQLAKTRLQSGEAFDKVSNELSKVTGDEIINGDLGWVTVHEADLTVGSQEFSDIISGTNTGVLSGPIYDDTVSKQFGYWVVKAIEKTDNSDNTTSAETHIQGILLGSEQEAEDVIDKLNAGADMNELAKQLSQLSGAKDKGAELGWIISGQITGQFSTLFDLPLNTVVGPVSENQTETKGGYWVFNVLEKNDNLALTSYQKNLLENDLLDRCIAELKKDPHYKVENLQTQETKDFALNKVVATQGKGSVLISTISLPDSEAGVSYSYKLAIYGNNKGNTWSITQGSLPDGLSLDTSTGVISGIPKLAGTSGFTVKVDSGLHYCTQELVIRIHIPVSVDTSSLPDGQVGVDYNAMLEVFGDSDSYTWSIITGSLPDGLNLDETTGYIYGTPTTAGTYNFTVQVDDGLKKDTQELSIRVQ